MSKRLYLSIFLSVILLNFQTSFGRSLKKDLDVCGKTLGMILSISPVKDPVLESAVVNDAEFCDKGRYESSANFKIYLYNSKDELIYDKHVYLSPLIYNEVIKADTGKFTKVSFEANLNTRIVKFPMNISMGKVSSYKLESLEKKKLYSVKKIKWEKANE